MRKAKVWLRPEEVERMLGLPEGMRLVAFDTAIDPPRLEVVVTAPWLDEVPPNSESPVVQMRRDDGSIDWRSPA